MNQIEMQSLCKVNLILNVLGKREDGFHELETLLYPVRVYDRIEIKKINEGIQLSCSDPTLPTNSGNLVYRAAVLFLEMSGIGSGVNLRLEKNIPHQAGLGGGSANAATTLRGLNELFDKPLSGETLNSLAGSLGSDVPFFLQDGAAMATGRGEIIRPVGEVSHMNGKWILVFHFGFGVPTGWAYQQLANHDECIHGKKGRGDALVSVLNSDDDSAWTQFYNSFEKPVFRKFPILEILKEFLVVNGAVASLLSGSGSAIFAVVEKEETGKELLEKVKSEFGESVWSCCVPA